MEYAIIGVAVALNLIIILWKFNQSRIFDGIIDSVLLGLVATVFSGSYGALVIGTIGSLIVSLYLLLSPPRLPDAPSGDPADIAKWLDKHLT